MGNNPILRNDFLGDSAGKPEPSHSNIGFRPAEPGQYDLHPVTAFLADLSYNIADLLQLTQAEQTIKKVADPKTSAVDKGFAVVSLGFAMSEGEGEGGFAEREGSGTPTDRVVPNPYGKKGSPAHQEVVRQVGAEMEADGYTVENEVRIETPEAIRKLDMWMLLAPKKAVKQNIFKLVFKIRVVLQYLASKRS
jgi:hypothetical protein